MARNFLDLINQALFGSPGGVVSVPDAANMTLVDTAATQTLTNKSLTSPTIVGGTIVSPTIFAPSGTVNVINVSGDGAIFLSNSVSSITKGSAAALTVAAPGSGNVGVMISITSATAFAHVVTFTGSTLLDGAGSAKLTATWPAVAGASITFVAINASNWALISKNNVSLA